MLLSGMLQFELAGLLAAIVVTAVVSAMVGYALGRDSVDK